MYLIRCDMWMGAQMEGMKLDSRLFLAKRKKNDGGMGKRKAHRKRKKRFLILCNMILGSTDLVMARRNKADLCTVDIIACFSRANAEKVYLDNSNKSAGTDRKT